MSGLPSLLDLAVERGIVTPDQRQRLLALQQESPAPGGEAPRGFNWVNVAYGLGALLVLFACAWFLVRQWEKLGPWGVIGVSLAYAAFLVVADRRLTALGFRRAGDLAIMLAVSLTPLAGWAVLRLTGEWPPEDEFAFSIFRQEWMASRWIVLELSVILAALLVLRKRRAPLLMHPIAVGMFWLWFHLSQTISLGYYSISYDRWMMFAASLLIMATAEQVERWQLEADVERKEGDFAGPFWLVGSIALAISYGALWGRLDEWKHLLPLLAAGMVMVALVIRRRALLALGMLGIFAYLVYLADEVFRNSGAFPIVLAALGIITILGTVWIQRRYPSLVQRFGSDSRRLLPWSQGMAWLPVFFAFSMALISLADAAEERANRAFQERLALLRQHSGSIRVPRSRPEPALPDTTQSRPAAPRRP